MKLRIGTSLVWLALASLVAGLAASLPEPAVAQGQNSRDQGPARIESLDFVEAPLIQVISVLTTESGAQFVISNQAALQQARVTASLRGVTVDEALTTILRGIGVPWYKDEMGVYMIGCEPPKAPEPEKLAPVVEAKAKEPAPQEMVLKKVVLNHMGVDDIYSYLLTGHLPIKKVNIGAELFGDNGQPGGRGYGRSQSAGDSSPFVPASGTGAAPDRLPWDARGDAASPGNEPSLASGYYGAPQSDPAQIRPPGGTAQPPTGAAAGQTFIPEGVTITPFPLDNSLLIRGPADLVKWLVDEVIPFLDIQPGQVEIKASFVTMTVDEANNWGIINWATRRGDLAVDYTSGTTVAGNLRIGYTTGDFNVALEALQSSGKGKVVTAPIITTMNNQLAQITLQEGYPIALPRTYVTSGGGVQTVYEPYYIQTATVLGVLPRINGDGTINVQIFPQVQTDQPLVNVPQFGLMPTLHGQALTTERVVADGQTIVLGGMTAKSTSYSEDKVPLLSEIPIVGPLFFTTKSKQVTDQELLIFLTPRVIPWPGLRGYAGLSGSGD
jgi:general secretion pathway protein D